MTARTLEIRPARFQVATALLATLGVLGLVGPSAVLAMLAFAFGSLTSGFATPEWLLFGRRPRRAANLSIEDPTAYSIEGVDPDGLLVVRAGRSSGSALQGSTYLVLVAESEDLADPPPEACAVLDFDDSAHPGGRCGPPAVIRIGELEYWATLGLDVPSSRLRPTGEVAIGETKWSADDRHEVFAIDGVEPSLVVAIRVDAAVLVYLSPELKDPADVPAALCVFASGPEAPDACRR